MDSPLYEVSGMVGVVACLERELEVLRLSLNESLFASIECRVKRDSNHVKSLSVSHWRS